MTSRPAERRATSLIATFITLVVVVIVWAAQNLFGGPAPVDEPPVAEPVWYQLYFTDPDRTAGLSEPAGGLPETIVTTFAAAQTSIDLAVYDIDLPVYADALVAAAARGVRVRVVTDSDYLNEAPVQALRLAGIPVVDDRRDAFMHHKFVVIDDALVWTGSLNFTFNDAYRNNNSMLLVRSTRLAENYTAQFAALFDDRQFTPAIVAPRPALNLSGALVETYFSPQGGVAAHLLDVLRAAQTSIHFMAFAFTRADFADVLIEKARAGVTVQGVFERRQVDAGADGAWQALRRAGLDVRLDGNPYVLHHKVIVVDRQIVILGSYNFSRNAEESNNENVLIVHNAEMAAQYLQEWERVWARAGDPGRK